MNNLRRLLILITLVVLIYFLYRYQQNSILNEEVNNEYNNQEEIQETIQENMLLENNELANNNELLDNKLLDNDSDMSFGSLNSEIYKQDSLVDDDSIGGLSDFDQKSEISNIDELFF